LAFKTKRRNGGDKKKQRKRKRIVCEGIGDSDKDDQAQLESDEQNKDAVVGSLTSTDDEKPTEAKTRRIVIDSSSDELS